MTILCTMPRLMSRADGARPAALWRVLIVVLAAAWLVGDRPATAQTIADDEPLIVEEEIAAPQSN